MGETERSLRGPNSDAVDSTPLLLGAWTPWKDLVAETGFIPSS